MSTTFRQIKGDESDTLIDFIRRCHADEGVHFDEPAVRATVRRVIRDDRIGYGWMIERSGEQIGYMLLGITDAADLLARKGYVYGLFIQRQFRGSGLGTKALSLVSQLGRTFGFPIHHFGTDTEDKLPSTAFEPRSFRRREHLSYLAPDTMTLRT